MESPCWSRLLAGPVDPWREDPTLEQICCQELYLCEGPTLEQPVPEGLQPMGRTQAGARAECEEEGVTEPMCDELTAAPIPLHHLGGGGREMGSEAEPAKKGEVGGRCF